MFENIGTYLETLRFISFIYASKHILCELAQTESLHVNISKINCMSWMCFCLFEKNITCNSQMKSTPSLRTH